MTIQKLAICIPTYKRTPLLKLLIQDIAAQTRQPQALIVVDGDPDSGTVRAMLSDLVPELGFPVSYIASNHGNLFYQRYLGWRAAQGYDLLQYFDDDLRLPEPSALGIITAPFAWTDDYVVGVTARTITGDLSRFADTEALTQRGNVSPLIARFGASRSVQPGGLSSLGHRKWPQPQPGQTYVPVEWLQGRVMAYRMDALDQNCYSADLFALTHVKCGLGEDTFLSRQVWPKGKMLVAFDVRVLHPDEDVPRAYPYQARRLAYATAYSRRFLNDHYRVTEPPHLSDRVDLLKSYAGNTLLHWARALVSFKRYRLAYAWGYTSGALRGLFQKPTARNLTPDIDWWADAEAALANAETLPR